LLNGGEPEAMYSYIAFVRHGINPERFARMSMRLRATIIAFIDKEVVDEKRGRGRIGRPGTVKME
jgi:hypothetical protein